MKKIAIIAAVLLLLGGVSSVIAATQMRLGAVTGLISADTARAGDSVRINIEWVNTDTLSYNPTVAWRIFSRASLTSGDYGSGTARWISTPSSPMPSCYFTLSTARPRTGPQVDTCGGFSRANFGTAYFFNCFGCDGQGVDTIAFAGAAGDASQLAIPANDSGLAFRLLLVTSLADTGKVICIDSSQKFPSTNVWKWAPSNAPGAPFATPSWSGMQCWYLKNPTPAAVIDVTNGDLPTTYELRQNYPNPFNPSTKIQFDLPKQSHVKVTVFNVLGQAVATLVDEEMTPGKKEVTWDGNSQTGVKVSSGTYFYKIVADDFVSTKKMLLLK
ncbi:MAG: T9SS type A sorting domain-containing protein [candidate division Zixibacteria bacterium]|nr:T9SS type A sorting domain-containing protein [candidate division Zixibacteria bacterium]